MPTKVVREKQLLARVQPCPLIVRLESAMQDKNCLFLLQEFINGGDLFHRLYNLEGCFPTPTVTTWVWWQRPVGKPMGKFLFLV